MRTAQEMITALIKTLEEEGFSQLDVVTEAREWTDRTWTEPALGPLAIAMEGGIVQSVCSDDQRLINNIRVLVIDYDTDSAETVYYVPQVDKTGVDPTCVSEAQLYESVCGPADGIDLHETWRRYMDDEVTLDCAKINAESEGYRVRRVPGSTTDRYEWFTTEAVAFVDYPNEDEAWMAAYKDLVQ